MKDNISFIETDKGVTAYIKSDNDTFYAQFDYKGKRYNLELCKKNAISVFYLKDIAEHDVMMAINKIDIEEETDNYIASNFKSSKGE